MPSLPSLAVLLVAGRVLGVAVAGVVVAIAPLGRSGLVVLRELVAVAALQRGRVDADAARVGDTDARLVDGGAEQIAIPIDAIVQPIRDTTVRTGLAGGGLAVVIDDREAGADEAELAVRAVHAVAGAGRLDAGARAIAGAAVGPAVLAGLSRRVERAGTLEARVRGALVAVVALAVERALGLGLDALAGGAGALGAAVLTLERGTVVHAGARVAHAGGALGGTGAVRVDRAVRVVPAAAGAVDQAAEAVAGLALAGLHAADVLELPDTDVRAVVREAEEVAGRHGVAAVPAGVLHGHLVVGEEVQLLLRELAVVRVALRLGLLVRADAVGLTDHALGARIEVRVLAATALHARVRGARVAVVADELGPGALAGGVAGVVGGAGVAVVAGAGGRRGADALPADAGVRGADVVVVARQVVVGGELAAEGLVARVRGARVVVVTDDVLRADAGAIDAGIRGADVAVRAAERVVGSALAAEGLVARVRGAGVVVRAIRDGVLARALDAGVDRASVAVRAARVVGAVHDGRAHGEVDVALGVRVQDALLVEAARGLAALVLHVHEEALARAVQVSDGLPAVGVRHGLSALVDVVHVATPVRVRRPPGALAVLAEVHLAEDGQAEARGLDAAGLLLSDELVVLGLEAGRTGVDLVVAARLDRRGVLDRVTDLAGTQHEPLDGAAVDHLVLGDEERVAVDLGVQRRAVLDRGHELPDRGLGGGVGGAASLSEAGTGQHDERQHGAKGGRQTHLIAPWHA